MKHFKKFLFFSIIYSLVFFTNCIDEIDGDFILQKLNGYYILEATSELNPSGTTIIQIKNGNLF